MESNMSWMREDQDVPLVRLTYFSTSTEAGQVLQLLLNNGIRALLDGANFGSLEPLPLPGGFSEIQLLVAEPDYERAKELYEAFFTRGDSIAPEEDPEDESGD